MHFFQIWILPERQAITPSYEQKAFGDDEKRGVLRLVASNDGRNGSVAVHQDIALYSSILDGAMVKHELVPNRSAWIQVASGEVDVNGTKLSAGDGAAIADERELTISGSDGAEFLLFDLE